jgi:rhodanese-related sulfurtransferase
MAPFEVIELLGKIPGYAVYLVIGVAFGWVLEMSGFGDSRKLAAQFYLKDMTVLKVMFTAIIFAMLLIFAFSSFELLDFSRIYVNPTFLWPGIVGGLIMGVGFIIGGFCPGTSVVALATLKLDGLFFVLGTFFGVFLFGETMSVFRNFHNSSFYGRLILPDVFGWETGWVIILLVVMALMMFYFSEVAEQFFGKRLPGKKAFDIREKPFKIGFSVLLIGLAVMTAVQGQPTLEDRWQWIANKEGEKLTNREVQIHPGELLKIMNDPLLYTQILDVRDEADFNLFHLENAQHTPFTQFQSHSYLQSLLDVPANTIIVLISNTEIKAIRAYKNLRAAGVLNVYVLEGGIFNWLKFFPPEENIITHSQQTTSDQDSLPFSFTVAIGGRSQASNPGLENLPVAGKFIEKVKIKKRKVLSGGCG